MSERRHSWNLGSWQRSMPDLAVEPKIKWAALRDRMQLRLLSIWRVDGDSRKIWHGCAQLTRRLLHKTIAAFRVDSIETHCFCRLLLSHDAAKNVHHITSQDKLPLLAVDRLPRPRLAAAMLWLAGWQVCDCL